MSMNSPLSRSSTQESAYVQEYSSIYSFHEIANLKRDVPLTGNGDRVDFKLERHVLRLRSTLNGVDREPRDFTSELRVHNMLRTASEEPSSEGTVRICVGDLLWQAVPSFPDETLKV